MIKDKLKSFLGLCNSDAEIGFRQGYYFLSKASLEKVIASGINFEDYGEEIRLELDAYLGKCEIQLDENSDKSIKNYSLDKPIAWVSKTGCCLYEPTTDIFSFEGAVAQDQERVFRNTVAYIKFYQFLKKICDYWNSANSEIVFYNSASGIIKVKYEVAPVIDFDGELSSDLEQIVQLASASQVTSVFVNAIFQLSSSLGDIAIKALVNNRKKLKEITERDYQLISKQFDFAKFRDSLYSEKEKYFAEIKDVVNKIFGQAIGVPISIGASVFTTYKVQGDNLVTALILFAFIGYMAFYLRLQWLYKSELDEVNIQFKQDFALIAANSGLPASTIDQEKLKIENRISSVATIQKWLIGLVIGLSVAVTIFMGSQFGPKMAESPDPTIKELTEAIKKLTAMTNTAQGSDENLQASPLNFSITVEFDKKTYKIDVTRYSFAGSPNEYWATIPSPDSVLNKFPPVKYTVEGNDLLFTDSLSNIYPGFAQKQKDVMLAEFKKNKWQL